MKFVIQGAKRLEGVIAASGSKNAATPIIAATLITKQPCIVKNIPKIGDVRMMCALLKSIGSRQRWLDEHTVEIINDELDPERLDQNLVAKIRSSLLLVGPFLARFGKITITTPGGCHIGSRPIDTHLAAFRALGAETEHDSGTGLYHISLEKPACAEVILREFSVTATENLLMLGARHPLAVKLAAQEPHVQDLGRFLGLLGVRISGLGTHSLRIEPPQDDAKKQISYTIANDAIEMGTFAILGAATKSRIEVQNVEGEQLDSVLEKLRQMGVAFEYFPGKLAVNGIASDLRAAKIETRPYPGLPSDLQAPFGVLASQAQGTSLIFDTLYDGRLRYIDELKKMGAEATILDPHRALIKGPSVLHGTTMESLDLRAGATLVIAALIAKGESVVNGAEQIDRGYEMLDERLRELGADIKRMN